jgi:hypothetical protein
MWLNRGFWCCLFVTWRITKISQDKEKLYMLLVISGYEFHSISVTIFIEHYMNYIVVAQASSPTIIWCDFNIDVLGECPMAAVNWPVKYFLDEDLQKDTLNLLSTDKNAHVCGALQEHLQQEIIS